MSLDGDFLYRSSPGLWARNLAPGPGPRIFRALGRPALYPEPCLMWNYFFDPLAPQLTTSMRFLTSLTRIYSAGREVNRLSGLAVPASRGQAPTTIVRVVHNKIETRLISTVRVLGVWDELPSERNHAHAHDVFPIGVRQNIAFPIEIALAEVCGGLNGAARL